MITIFESKISTIKRILWGYHSHIIIVLLIFVIGYRLEGLEFSLVEFIALLGFLIIGFPSIYRTSYNISKIEYDENSLLLTYNYLWLFSRQTIIPWSDLTTSIKNISWRKERGVIFIIKNKSTTIVRQSSKVLTEYTDWTLEHIELIQQQIEELKKNGQKTTKDTININ